MNCALPANVDPYASQAQGLPSSSMLMCSPMQLPVIVSPHVCVFPTDQRCLTKSFGVIAFTFVFFPPPLVAVINGALGVPHTTYRQQ